MNHSNEILLFIKNNQYFMFQFYIIFQIIKEFKK